MPMPSNFLKVACGCSVLFYAMTALAQPLPASPQAETVLPSHRPSIQLDTNVAIGAETWTRTLDQTWVRNVAAAAIYPVRPSTGRANGRAVIVVPGGGYQFVSISSEGFDVADRLAAEGYTAFVLKYRVIQTPADPREFMVQFAQSSSQLGKRKTIEHPPAVEDVAEAIDFVKARSAEYGVDPARISLVGFSAGARTSIRFLEQHQQGNFLNNVALIYPPTDEVAKPGPRPPLFLAIAVDDPLFQQGGLKLLNGWLQESQKVEFHLYSGGRHGFGMRPRGTTSDRWFDQYLQWLNRQ